MERTEVMRLFVDTSAWVALEDRDDSHHEEATRFWGELRAGRADFRQIFTSNYVLDEVMTLLGTRVGKQSCAEFWRKMQGTKLVRVLRVSEEVDAKAFEIFVHGPEDLSFTDGTCFALMRGEAIDSCFTFDRHFADFGFTMVPAK